MLFVKFCSDNQSTHPRSATCACLAALEVGEKSDAIAASNRVPLGKEGFGDWWPPSMSPRRAGVRLGCFKALVERWYRLMKALSGR